MVDAVSALWGTYIVPVCPELIISTDDTTEFIFEGTKNVAPKFVLATKSTIQKRGTNAIYRPEDSKATNGMHVKLTFSFTAEGNSFPIAVTVSGLTEKEMPPGENFIHVKIPGMSVIAACMILSRHLAMGIKCLGKLSCLLAPNANTFIPCADNSSINCQGAYLYFDSNRGTFIRSGKVVRQGFVDRHKEHMAESKKDKPESDFYLLYPSKHCGRSNKRVG